MFCLPPQEAEKLKKAFKDGKISPDKLVEMTSTERRELFDKYLSAESAKEVNLLFEKKLLLVNQEKAMYDWAREVTGLSKNEKEELSEKIRARYAVKKERLYNPAKDEVFLGELASDVFSRKYRTDVSTEEAQIIAELANDAQKKLDIVEDKLVDGEWATERDRLKYGIDYGSAKVALDNYVGHLKREANKEYLVNPLNEKTVQKKALAVLKDARIAYNFIADNSRAIVAGFFDNSFFGRQGRQALSRPATSRAWLRNFAQSLMDMYSVLRYGQATGDAIQDGIKAEIYSRTNFLNGNYERGKKVDIGTGEEEFPTSLPAKIPYLGRLFKSSEVAYEGGAMRLRADIADAMYTMAEKQGLDLNDKEEIKAINDLVNIMTGRGSLGSYENIGKELNRVFFSAKFAKSQVDKLTRPVFAKTRFAKKQAALNLITQMASVFLVMGMFELLWPDSVEWDPRSADFGKLKIGNTRIDLTGGIASYMTLAARIIKQSTKSSTTGIIAELNDGYGSQDGMDLFWNFIENKTSPMASVIKDLVKQQTFEGDKPTLLNESRSLLTPILAETVYETTEIDGAATALLALIAEGMGFSAGTYTYRANWNASTSKELTEFKERVGQKTFDKANKEYNSLVADKIEELKKNPNWQNLSDEDKQKELTKEKRKIKDRVLSKYR